MTVPRRSLYLTLITGLVLSVCYLLSVWYEFASPSGRTLTGRIFGLLGLATSLAASGSYAWHRRRASTADTDRQDTCHLALGGLAVWLILLHASFRFGNVVALLAFLALLGTVVSGIAVMRCDRQLGQFTARSAHSEHIPVAVSRYQSLRQRWLALHIATTSGLFTFALVHILSIFYY